MNNLKSKKYSTYFLFIGIYDHLSRRRKKQILLLLALSIFSGFAEIFSISTIVPFLAALINPDVLKNEQVISYFPFLNQLDLQDLRLLMTLIFILSSLLAGFLRIIYQWITLRIVALTGSDLSQKIYNNIICQSYEEVLSNFSNEYIASLTIRVNECINAIELTLLTFSSFIVINFILIPLLIFNIKVTITALLIFSFLYLFLSNYTKTNIKRNSRKITNLLDQQINIIEESFGLIQDILLSRLEKFYIKKYRKMDMDLRIKLGNNRFFQVVPKYIVESFGLCIIASLGYFYSRISSSNFDTITLLGVFALASQKMLPYFQNAYANIQALRSRYSDISIVLNLLNIETQETDDNFKDFKFKSLMFDNVYFKFKNNDNYTLENLNFEIKKGERIAIIGESGSGKTTLSNLIKGLLLASKGKVLLNGKIIDQNNIFLIKSLIAHVSQDTFISNSSIFENIAVGENSEDIDFELVFDSCLKSQIGEFISNRKEAMLTNFGDKGNKLSGGQKQRIAIARALYKKRSILILDEPTSSLDIEVEKNILSAINSLPKDLTIIIVTHRKSILTICDRVLEIKRGRLVSDSEIKR